MDPAETGGSRVKERRLSGGPGTDGGVVGTGIGAGWTVA